MRDGLNRARLAARCGAALLLAGACLPQPAAAGERAGGSDLALSWQIERLEAAAPGSAQRVTVARLSVMNRGRAALPSSAWALYFTSLAGVQPAATGRFVAEQVVGTLYRLRPGPAFEGLAAGSATSFDIVHPEEMAKTDKAPKGPYLAYDDAPEQAAAIGSYDIVPGFPRSANLPADRQPEVGAEEIFDRNAAIDRVSGDELPLVFPPPLRLTRRSGVLRIDGAPAISGPRELSPEIARARALFAARPGAAPSRAPGANLRLALTRVPGQASDEAYALDIDPVEGIALSGNSPAGVSRGLESLRQLLPLEADGGAVIALPALNIVDAPRFGFRGMLVDVARNFQRKEALFRLIELMARFKMNRLHLHLSDDEGWRLAIRGLPELTGVGARRGHAANENDHLLPAYGSGPRVDDPHGSGHYSAADFVAILRYAAARRIEVIPELEMPGHARAAVTAMRARARALRGQGRADAEAYSLADAADASRYRSAQMYSDNVIDPGLESSYRFIAHVVAEVHRLYRLAGLPLRTIHVGADELADGAWEGSPACLALMKARGLASTAELWDYFYERVAGIAKRHGATLSGWEELGARKTRLRGRAKLIPNPVFARRGFDLFVWNNLEGAEDLAYRLANAGYRVVLAPATVLYFDMAHDRDPREPGVNWAAYTDIDAVYDFVPQDFLRASPVDPTPRPGLDALTDYGRGNIIGLEGTLFSEVMRDPATIDYLLLPRLLGLAERAWAADPDWALASDAAEAKRLHRQAWSRFASQLGQRVLARIDLDWPDLRYRIPPPGIKRIDGRFHVNHQFPGFILRYTTDGSVPNATSPEVAGPIAADGVLTVAAFARNGRMGRVSRSTPP